MGHGKHSHHGRTPAAWAGSAVAGAGFLIGTAAFFMGPNFMGPNWVMFWISIVLLLAGAVIGGVMSRMGLGQGG